MGGLSGGEKGLARHAPARILAPSQVLPRSAVLTSWDFCCVADSYSFYTYGPVFSLPCLKFKKNITSYNCWNVKNCLASFEYLDTDAYSEYGSGSRRSLNTVRIRNTGVLPSLWAVFWLRFQFPLHPFAHWFVWESNCCVKVDGSQLWELCWSGRSAWRRAAGRSGW